MKLTRIRLNGHVIPALLDEHNVLRDLSNHISDITSDTVEALDQLRAIDPTSLPAIEGKHTVAPCIGHAGKFMCIGLNYSDHAAEAGMEPPKEPILFLKANSAICGAEDDLVLPRGSVSTDWEVELGVVIGKVAKYVSVDQALDHVAGYCVANDVSERDFQMRRGGQWTKGKSCDTFGPLGPYLATRDEVPDPQALQLALYLNGKQMQLGTTANMIFSVAEIIAYLSDLMTLYPGDVIATGTPPGVGMGMKPEPVFLKPGDLVEAQIEGLGSQRQRVRSED